MKISLNIGVTATLIERPKWTSAGAKKIVGFGFGRGSSYDTCTGSGAGYPDDEGYDQGCGDGSGDGTGGAG